jgi:molecular chaperone DnaK
LKGVETVVIKNNLDQDITQSAVSYDKKGNLYVGERAKKRAFDKPNDGYVEFKRRMGTEFVYSFAESGLNRKPEELSAEVLKSLKADVSRTTGEEIRTAVITVPAAFKLEQCDATKKAGELAGLISCPLLQEPVAAALAYGFQIDSEKAYWLAYDFGGGTFDAALIKAEEGLIHVVHHGGDNFLGGSDIDWAIIEKLIIPKLVSSYNLPDFNRANVAKWGKAIRSLKLFIEAGKIDLSTKPSTSLLDCIFEDADGDEVDCSEITITRDELIRVAEPIINRSIGICQKVLKEKNLPASAVQKVILVGGPTKAPYFREMLANGLGISIDHSVDPLTVVARGAAVFAGTQKVDSRLKVAAKTGEFKIDLKYKPVGHDTEPLVGGKIESLDGSSVEGFVLEFINSKTQWRSGKLTLGADGVFATNLFANKGERNVFTIELHDALGGRQKPVPDEFTYTVGAVVEEQPLINSMGIALATNEVEWFFEKGAGLPLKKKSTYGFRTTEGLVTGTDGVAIRVPVIEGEADVADHNHLIGVWELTSSSIKRDLPQGSEVELTLKMDESRIITIIAYIPILDEEFETTFNPRTTTTIVPILIEEHDKVIKRLDVLLKQAREMDDPDATSALEKLRSSPIIKELSEAMAIAKGDPDAATKGKSRLLELKIEIDAIENKMKWPMLVADIREWLEALDSWVKQSGKQAFQTEAKKLENEIEKIIANKETDRLGRKLNDVRDLLFQVRASVPAFWINHFNFLQKDKSKFIDQAKAQRLFDTGQNYLAQNNLDGLKNVVRQLWEILPKQVFEEMNRAFGSTVA